MDFQTAIDNFLIGYFSTCRRSEKTRKAYDLDLAQSLEFFGQTNLDLVTVDQLEAWAAELKSRPYAPVSIRRKFATLRVFFAYWVRKGELKSSPLWKIRLDLGRQEELPKNLTITDSKSLIEAAWERVNAGQVPKTKAREFLAARDLAAVEILFATGIRVGELVSLQMHNWREDDASLLVAGKGFRQRLAYLADRRSVAAIKAYLELRRTFTIDHSAMLINVRGGRLSTQGVSRILTCLCAHANVQRHVTPHMIRHTVATLLLRHGADIRVVQEILGHASIVTTQRYTHVSKEHLIETLRAHHPNGYLNIEQGRSPRIAGGASHE